MQHIQPKQLCVTTHAQPLQNQVWMLIGVSKEPCANWKGVDDGMQHAIACTERQ